MPTDTNPLQSIDSDLSLHFTHRIRFTNHAFDPNNQTLCKLIRSCEPIPALACIDQGVLDPHPDLPDQLIRYAAAHPQLLSLATQPTVIPGGEIAKNDLRIFEQIIQSIHSAGLCRHSLVLAIGGGAVLDAVGFAAAIAHRGIRLIRIPTTTLAQADSGVGVKNGINAFGQKNFLGTFALPWGVVNDESFLWSLSERDWRAGLSEAVKVALIKDPNLFDQIIENTALLRVRDLSAITPIIRRSAELHFQHITQSGDPFELSTARPLDFGHWAAHRLETLTGHTLGHGEAVAIGIALDCAYSTLAGFLPHAQTDRIIQTLQTLGFDTYHQALEDIQALAQGINEFRMHLGGQLNITLLKEIGQPFEVDTMDDSLIARAIQHLGDTADQDHG